MDDARRTCANGSARRSASLLALLTASFMVWAGVVWNATDKVMVRIDTIVAGHVPRPHRAAAVPRDHGTRA